MALTQTITPAATPAATATPTTGTINTPGGAVTIPITASTTPAAPTIGADAGTTPSAGGNLFSRIVDSALASSPLVGTVAPQNQITLGVPADAYAAATQKMGWLEVAAAIGMGGIIYLLFLRK